MNRSSRSKSFVRRTAGSRRHASWMISDKRSAVTTSASRSLSARRDMAGFMPPISSAANMNSRAVGLQSHRRRIKPPSVASAELRNWFNRKAEAAQRGVGAGFVPVIEHRIHRFLAIEHGNDGAKDG